MKYQNVYGTDLNTPTVEFTRFFILFFHILYNEQHMIINFDNVPVMTNLMINYILCVMATNDPIECWIFYNFFPRE